MLISFSFENFKSFADRAELSLVANNADKTHPGATIVLDEEQDMSVLPSAAIYGANAAGKTNVILALQFMRWAVMRSQAAWEPGTRIPITCHTLREDRPSTFEVSIFVNGTRYRYGFSTDKQIFIKEWLYSYPSKRERVLFERETISTENGYVVQVRYGPSFEGNRRALKYTEDRTRPNSLYLSSAAQDNHGQALIISEWFSRSLTIETLERPREFSDIAFAARMCAEHPAIKSEMLALIRSADSNIVDILTEEGPEISTTRSENMSEFERKNARYDVHFLSMSGTDKIILPMSVQSRGVKKMFAIGTMIIFSLMFGEVLVIDELETSIHPHVASMIVELFQSPSTNKNNAQLIFSTHETRFLNIRSLRRDQIWFVEKENTFSHLYPLLEFAPRKDESLENGYLRGRYGAIPALGYIPELDDLGSKVDYAEV